jgi:hypothetical protein
MGFISTFNNNNNNDNNNRQVVNLSVTLLIILITFNTVICTMKMSVCPLSKSKHHKNVIYEQPRVMFQLPVLDATCQNEDKENIIWYYLQFSSRVQGQKFCSINLLFQKERLTMPVNSHKLLKLKCQRL